MLLEVMFAQGGEGRGRAASQGCCLQKASRSEWSHLNFLPGTRWQRVHDDIVLVVAVAAAQTGGSAEVERMPSTPGVTGVDSGHLLPVRAAVIAASIYACSSECKGHRGRGGVPCRPADLPMTSSYPFSSFVPQPGSKSLLGPCPAGRTPELAMAVPSLLPRAAMMTAACAEWITRLVSLKQLLGS